MALDKVIDSAQLDANLVSVADAIRERGGISSSLEFPSDFISEIGKLGNVEQHLADVLNLTATEIVNSMTTRIPGGFQEGNTNLTKVSLPSVTVIESNSFNACSALTDIHFPAVTTMYSAAFNGAGITQVYLPKLTTLDGWGYTFYSCRNMTKAYFPKLITRIADADFHTCRSLETLILGSDTFCPLNASNVFSQTPIAGYNGATGYIYVKKALIDTYKTATNWSVYANQFRAIEDYPSVLEGWE